MAKQVVMRAKVGELAKVLAERRIRGRVLATMTGMGEMLISGARAGKPIRRSAAMAIAGALQVPVEQLFEQVAQAEAEA